MPYFFMSIEEMKCSGCGATLKESTAGRYYCEHCGKEYYKKEEKNEFDVISGLCKGYTGQNETNIVIPQNVLIIDSGAFANNKGLTQVTIPEGIIEIGDDAFLNCERLSSVTLPKSLEKIGNRAFRNSGIEKVFIPNSVNKIGAEAFADCKNLLKATLTNKNLSKLNKTFNNCTHLQTVDFNFDLVALAFIPGNKLPNNEIGKPTLYDVFRNTPFFNELKQKVLIDNICPFCNTKLKKKFLSSKLHCETCTKIFFRIKNTSGF